uniref:C2H2-type domain-containing protein n=1 Tax=Strigamia maritima TaxID=126957 RepID=T1JK55_STRMM
MPLLRKRFKIIMVTFGNVLWSKNSIFNEDLTCNVCDRSFASARLLGRHQQKRRHFACSVCESLFSSLIMLEHHKEEYDHWSEDEGDSQDSEDGDDDADDEAGTKKSEEMERLL